MGGKGPKGEKRPTVTVVKEQQSLCETKNKGRRRLQRWGDHVNRPNKIGGRTTAKTKSKNLTKAKKA